MSYNARPPAPLRFRSSQSTDTLLYDLPSASPPTSPTSRSPPTSPRTPRPRRRSLTPSGISTNDLDRFSEHCRAWYFNQDEESGRLMTQTMAALPTSQRAPYSRLQASIRSSYHRFVNARRNAEFQAHLSATQPGASLTPHSRAQPRGQNAQKERYDRLERFIRNWCSLGMPGPQPFFTALWALFRLQVVPDKHGGAGNRRIEWEFDDAVLKESAGKDFMLEAIDILKGVLGFEEAPSRRLSTGGPETNPDTSAHLRSKSSPPFVDLDKDIATLPKRARAPSDPFLDTPPTSRPVYSSSPSSTTSSSVLSTVVSDASEEHLVNPAQTSRDNLLSSSRNDNVIESIDEEYMRVWTSPDLTNTEYYSLLKLFPPMITRRSPPHFPTRSVSRPLDLEEGYSEDKHISCGTGTMWISTRKRSAGWEGGGWWTRFISWWKKTFFSRSAA